MILKFKELKNLKKYKTIYTAGSFDLFHRGHLEYLKKLKENYPNHKLVVGVLPDKRIQKKKGSLRPIIKEIDRVNIIDSIQYVDYSFICPVFKEGEDATFKIINEFSPRFVLFPYKSYLKITNKFEKYGSQFKVFPRVKNQKSTSQIIKKIQGKS